MGDAPLYLGNNEGCITIILLLKVSIIYEGIIYPNEQTIPMLKPLHKFIIFNI